MPRREILTPNSWAFGHPPMSRAWTEAELGELKGTDRDLGQLALLIAKASFQVDDDLIARASTALGNDESALISLGAWAAARGALRVAQRVASSVDAGRATVSSRTTAAAIAI